MVTTALFGTDSVANGSGAHHLIHSYSETNSDTTGDLVSTVTGLGQTFTSDGSVLDSAKFYMKKESGATLTGSINAKLYAVTGTLGSTAIPTGTALAVSDNFNPNTITNGVYNLETFTFSGGNRYAMTNGTVYAITVEDPTPRTTPDCVAVGYDGSSPTDPGNTVVVVSGSWSAAASDDTCFYVYGV